MGQAETTLGSLFRRRNILWLLLILFLAVLLFSLNKTVNRYTVAQQLDADIALHNLMKATTELLHNTQRERGYTTGFLIHSDADQTDRNQYWDATDARLVALNQIIAQLDTSIYSPRFKVAIENVNTVSQSLAELRQAAEVSSLSSTEAFRQYTEISSQLLAIAEHSIFYLADAELAQRLSGFLNLLRHQELMGQERAILIDAFAGDHFAPGLFRRFIAIVAEEKKYLELFLFLSDRQTDSDFYEITARDVFVQAKTMRQRAIERAGSGGFGIAPNDWWRVQTASIEHYYAIGADVLAVIQKYLQQRQRDANQQLLICYLLIIGSLLAIFALMIYFWRIGGLSVANGKALAKPTTTLTTLTITVLLLLVTVATLLFFSYSNISSRLKEQVLGTMSDILNSSHETLREIWLKSAFLEAENWAANPLVISQTQILLQAPQSSSALQQHPAQQAIRGFFQQQLSSPYQKGMFIVSPDYHNLASMRDVNLGAINFTLSMRPEALAEALAGKTSLVLPLLSDVPLKTRNGDLMDNWPTMFIATPIFDEQGLVLAALMVRIDPFEEFSLILTKDKLWNSGETYAFDSAGRMVTQSRFEEQLLAEGGLELGQTSLLNIEIREPAKHSIEGGLLGKAPLTLMAQRAVLGQNGHLSQPYPDYRGIPVIGVWLWDAELGLGIVTEVDESEVLASIRPIGNTMITGFLLVALLSVMALLFFYRTQKKSFNVLLHSMAEIKKQQAYAEENAASLQEAQAQFKAVVDNTADSIVVINRQGIIESVNPALLDMFGYLPEDLIGKNVNLLMPEPDHSGHDGYLQRYMQTGQGKVIGTGREVFARRADGSVFPVDLTVSEFLLGDELHFAGTLRDISERKKAEAELVRAREEAEAANLAKSTFLATMSHEIRTPLNGVVGGIDMLAHTALEQHQQDLIHTAQDSAAILQRVIDDTLDFSKIEAGHLELEELPLSLEELVESFAESLRPLAQQKHCELFIYCDPRLPEVLGDPVRLKQILFNLTGNAIKFSTAMSGRPGKVMVSLSLLAEGAEQVDICCRIADNGIGMDENVQQRLFIPFMQGEGDTTRRFGGTGLGLVITQRLVELMGGYIEVESEINQGSSFAVFLSLPKTGNELGLNITELSAIPVLLIQSDAQAAELLVSYLEHAGAEVTVVTADQALQHYQKLSDEQLPAVVVIDNPQQSEFIATLCEQLRNEQRNVDLRFVKVERGQRRYARLRNEDSMTLDLNVMRRRTFINAVAAVTGRESPQQGPGHQGTTTLVDPWRYDQAHSAERHILLADDNEINRKVIGQQLNMLGYAVDFAKDGQQAFSLWQQGDYNLLMTDCHMPNMDGYQLARNIRNAEKPGERMPIVAVTADAMKGTSRKCYLAGMDDYITKPMQLHDLDEMLKKWLPEAGIGSSQSEHQDDAENAENAESRVSDMTEQQSSQKHNGDQPAIDAEVLPKLLGSDEAVMLMKFYHNFLHSSRDILAQLEQACDAQDTVQVGELGHKLKSSARSMGADKLADSCFELEQAGKQGDMARITQQLPKVTELFNQVQDWISVFETTHL